MRRVVTGLGLALAGVGVLLLAGALAFLGTFEDTVFVSALWGFGLLLAGALAAGIAHWGVRGALFGAGTAFLVLGFTVAAGGLTVANAAERFFAMAADVDAMEAVIGARAIVGAGLVLMFAGAVAIAVFTYTAPAPAQPS